MTKIISKLKSLVRIGKFPNKGKGKMALVDIANVMAQIEGWNIAGSLAQRNNNPLNLRFAGQHGAILGEAGFAKFASAEDGFRAGERQIELDASRGLDVTSFINKFAPPNENNTSNYISLFTSKLGVSASDKLSTLINGDGIISASNMGGESSFDDIDPTVVGIVVLAGIGLVIAATVIPS